MTVLLAVSGCVGGGSVEIPPGTTSVPTATTEVFHFDGPVPRNLLVLSLDTLRRDATSRYAPDDTLTPFMDAKAAEGVVLDDVMACSNWTVASTACVLSGAENLDRAEERGMVPIIAGARPLEDIPKGGDPNGPTPMLPRWLAEQGYSSLLVTSNGFFSGAYGNAQGFDEIDSRGAAAVPVIWQRAAEHILPASGGTPLPEPWYLHLHFFEPHSPYTPPEEYVVGLEDLPPTPLGLDLSTEFGQGRARDALNADPPVLTEEEAARIELEMRLRYDGEVRRFDAGLADLWGDLEENGLLDDALVVFFTDHGEAFWEHGPGEHGKFLYREENDAIVWFWARGLEPDTWSGPVSQIDVAPTVLELLGFPIPPEVTGIPVGQAPADRPRFALADAYMGPVQLVRKGSWQMQFRWPTGPETNLALYDLSVDPGETTNLFDPLAPSPEALELWELLRPQVEAAEPWIAADPRGWTVGWPEGLPH